MGKKLVIKYSYEMNPKPLNFFLSLAILSLSCETLRRSAIKSDWNIDEIKNDWDHFPSKGRENGHNLYLS